MRGYITHGVIIALAVLAIGGSWLATRVQNEPEAETFGDAPRVLTVPQGGTGTSTVPNLGEVLVGLSDGTYKPTATSSLGITSSLPTITISGDVDGTGTTSIVTTVDNDSHDHTGLTLSGIDISDDTNLSGDTEVVLTGDALSLGNTLSFSYASTTGISGTNLNFTNATSTSSFFSALGTFTNAFINTLLTAVSGIFTTSLQIPNGTAPTVDATGEIALDTTYGQLKYFDGGTTHVLTGTSTRSFRVASSTIGDNGNTYWNGTSTMNIHSDFEGVTIVAFECTATTTGTALVRFTDGTNSTNTGSCSTAGTTTYVTSNGGFTASEDLSVQIWGGASTTRALRISTSIIKTAQ